MTINEIVEALRKNDEELHQLFAERDALVKNLTAEESHEVWSLLYSDNLLHFSF